MTGNVGCVRCYIEMGRAAFLASHVAVVFIIDGVSLCMTHLDEHLAAKGDE